MELVGGVLAVGEDVLTIDEAEQETETELVDALPDGAARVVRFARDVYSHVPTRELRCGLLTRARRAATDAVVLHARVSDENSYLGRLAIDMPRKVLHAAGVDVPESGDRFGPNRFAHCFFDEESLLAELTQAGLTITKRRGFTFVLRAGIAPPESAEPFAMEMARVVAAVRRIDEAPRDVLAAMRALGAAASKRGPVGRARLRRAIGWVDALVPGGASCYRRILLEVALDAGAARETVVFGLDVGSTGHVAFLDREERTFDVAFAIPPER